MFFFYQNDSPSEKSQDIISHLTLLLIEQCQCNIDMNTAITNGGFQCFANSQEFVTYRAQVQGTSEVPALDLVQILQQWVSSGPSVNIKAQILDVKSSCPVLIASLSEAECDCSTSITTFNDKVTDAVTNSVMDGISDIVNDSDPSTDVNLTTIIIISIVCATLIILVIAFVIIVYLRLRSSVPFIKKSIPNK